MKKLLIISLFIILAIPTSQGNAVWFDGNLEYSDLAWGWLASDNREWPDGSIRFSMMADMGVAENGYQDDTYIKPTEDPWTQIPQIQNGTKLGAWGQFFGIPETGYLFDQALGWPDPLDHLWFPYPQDGTPLDYGNFYETSYQFQVGSDPETANNLYFDYYIPDGTIQQLGLADATITGGVHPTVSWAGVTDANQYRFRIIDPNDNAFLFDAYIDF